VVASAERFDGEVERRFRVAWLGPSGLRRPLMVSERCVRSGLTEIVNRVAECSVWLQVASDGRFPIMAAQAFLRGLVGFGPGP
jgi:hypothetical protein